MSVLDRKLGRDLLGARATLLSILVVIVLGEACFVGIATTFVNLERSRRAYYAQCRMADFWVSLRRAPLTAVRAATDRAGIAEAQPRITFDAIIDLPNASRPISGRIISRPDTPRTVLNDIVLLRGSGFTPQRLEEVIVNDTFARHRDIHPGQTIHVILGGRRQELFVVGTAVSSEFTYLIGPGSIIPEPQNYGILYVKQSFAEEALDFHGACNEIVGLFTPRGEERGERLLEELEHALNDYGVFATAPLSQHSSHRFLMDEINGLRVMAITVPMIFLGVAALILNILLSRLAEQQRSTIGTLKAIGYSNRALSWHYLKFAIAVGVTGAAVGTLAGYAMAEGMTGLYRRFYDFPRLENRPFPAVFTVALAMSVGFSMLGSLKAVRAVLRLSPAEAMRPRPPVTGGTVALERYRRLWRRLGFRWQMVIRNVWRHRWRTAVSMLAAALGSALMLLAFYSDHAMNEAIDLQFDKVLMSDVDLRFKDTVDGSAVLEARRLPGVDRAEPLLETAGEFRHGHRRKKSGIIGVAAGATLTIPRDMAGNRVAVPETGLAMSRKLAEILDVEVGGSVLFEPIRGDRRPRTVTVTRITDAFIGMASYADYDFLNRLLGEVDAVTTVQLRTERALESRLELYRNLKTLPSLQAFNDNVQSKANLIDALMGTMKFSIAALIGFAAAIYCGSILTTSLVALAEREREIATLLVIGYDKRQVGGIFLRESLLVNGAGAVAGLPIGFAFIAAVVKQYDTEVYRLPLVVTPASFAVSAALAVLFALLAHRLVQMAINRLDWKEALNARE